MINANNLLPTRNVPITGSFSAPTMLESLEKINSNLLSAKKLILKSNERDKKRAKIVRTQAEQTKRRESESQREVKKDPKNAVLSSGLKMPRFGFLDFIKNFLVTLILGYGAIKLIDFLPKILEISKNLIPLAKGFENLVGGIFNGLASAIDNGYKAYDSLRGLTKTIGGENFQKTFDDFSGKLNTFINAAVLIGLAVAGSGALGGRGGSPRQSTGTRQRPTVTEGTGGTRQRPGSARITGDTGTTPRPRPASSAGRQVTEGMGDLLASRAGRKAFLTSAKNLVSKIKLPVIGGLIEFGLLWALGEDPGRAAFRAIGATLLGQIGMGLGGAVGLAGGPLSIAGALLGGAAGGALGDLAGGALYDLFFGGKTGAASKETVEARAKGGQVGNKKAPPRTIKKAPRRPKKYQPQKSKPGANIGGIKEIEKLFTNPKESDVKSPLRSLETSAKNTKKIPLLGGIMGASIEMAMGQNMDKNVIKNFSNNLGILVQNIADKEIASTSNEISRSIYAMADGGVVPSTRTIGTGKSIGEQLAEAVSKTLEVATKSRIDEIFRDIKRELNLKDPAGPGGPLPDGTTGGLTVASDSPDFWLLATAALFENSHPQGAADVAQAIYNRVAMPGDPWHTGGSIRTAILAPGQFQPVSDYGGAGVWGNIKDKQSAIAFVKKYGRTQDQLEAVSAALLDTRKQKSARDFVGPRDSFRSVSYENSNNHLADDTEVRREGHVFGFEPRGATISSFRAGKLKPAEINKEIKGDVEYLVGANDEVFPLPRGNPQFNTTEGYMGGTFTSSRRGGRQHKGQDIGVDPNSPVLAMKSGVVEDIYRDYGGVGDAVVVRYSDGQVGIYGHVNPTVGKGTSVKAGQKIATVFDEGSNTHLHYMRRTANGTYVDPLPLLRQLKSAPVAANKPSPKPQPPANNPSKGRVIRSVDLGGNIITERENKQFTLNGKPIPASQVETYKRNFSDELKDFNTSSISGNSPSAAVANVTPSQQNLNQIAKISNPDTAMLSEQSSSTVAFVPIINSITTPIPVLNSVNKIGSVELPSYAFAPDELA
jgi:murein DD-endopeptidase MepM/ murein hydrolase activator NlpD